MKRLLLAACVSLSLVACAGSAKTFRINGTEKAVAAMSGEWSGDYDSPATGRTGSVYFSLQFGRQFAEGEVEMNVPGEAEPRVLRITSMHVNGVTVSGHLARYQDPACDCLVDTEFKGTLSGDIIDGTFTSMRAGSGPLAAGVWRAERTGR